VVGGERPVGDHRAGDQPADRVLAAARVGHEPAGRRVLVQRRQQRGGVGGRDRERLVQAAIPSQRVQARVQVRAGGGGLGQAGVGGRGLPCVGDAGTGGERGGGRAGDQGPGPVRHHGVPPGVIGHSVLMRS
jgi:hypothetical protein